MRTIPVPTYAARTSARWPSTPRHLLRVCLFAAALFGLVGPVAPARAAEVPAAAPKVHGPALPPALPPPAPRLDPRATAPYRAGRFTHTAGNVVFLASAALIVPSAYLLANGLNTLWFSYPSGWRRVGAFAQYGVGLLGVLYSGVGLLTGPIASNAGSILATSSLGEGRTPVFAIAGLSVYAIGLASAVGALATSDPERRELFAYTALAMPVASLGLSVLQMQVTRGAAARSVTVLPTPTGATMVGRF